jgi:hypothetical protein
MFDESTLKYFDGLRLLGELQEKHWVEDVLPPAEALNWLSSAYNMLSPESHEWARKDRDWRGFSELLKALSLLRV